MAKKKQSAKDLSELKTKQGTRVAYECIPAPEGFIPTPPNQEVPESEKDEEWYIKNVQYICSYYNVSFQNVVAPIIGENAAIGTNKNQPVYQMIKYMQYYLGQQPNLDYHHLTQNVDENNLQATWIKGQDISELIKFMKGNILDRINNIQISARPMSEDAVSEREDMLRKLVMVKVKQKHIFERFKEMGMEYEPGDGTDFQSENDIKKWVDEGGFKDIGAEYATDIANNFWYTNHCASKFVQAFNYTTICGCAAMEHIVQDGKVFMTPRLPYQLILDTRVDEDYNREAQFIGTIDCMTPSQIFSRWKVFSEKQKEDIYEMSKDQELGMQYNNISNFTWWNYNGIRQTNTVSAVTVYWYGRHDLGLKKGKDKFGVNVIGKTPKGEDGDYVVTDIHKATLIGNRYLVDYGYLDNIVEEFTDKKKPVFPILRFMPDMVGGEFISIVGRLHKLQDEIDAMNFKIREMIGRSKGKVYIIKGEKLSHLTNAQTLIEDFSKMGVHVGATTGEAGENKNDSIVEQVDMTLDPNVNRLVELVALKQNAMKEVVSTSNIALGQQTSYIGLGTQQATIGQTTFGLKYLYDGFLDFVQHNLQYAINIEGRLLSMNDDIDTAMIVGDKGKKYLDVMKLKNLSFEDILIYIKLNDSIDQAEKESLKQAVFSLFQNDKITLTEFAEIMSARTYTELKNKAEYYERIRERKAIAQEKMAHQQQLQLQQQQIQGNIQAEALRQSGQDVRQNAANDAAIQQQILQQQVQTQPQ